MALNPYELADMVRRRDESQARDFEKELDKRLINEYRLDSCSDRVTIDIDLPLTDNARNMLRDKYINAGWYNMTFSNASGLTRAVLVKPKSCKPANVVQGVNQDGESTI